LLAPGYALSFGILPPSRLGRLGWRAGTYLSPAAPRCFPFTFCCSFSPRLCQFSSFCAACLAGRVLRVVSRSSVGRACIIWRGQQYLAPWRVTLSVSVVWRYGDGGLDGYGRVAGTGGADRVTPGTTCPAPLTPFPSLNYADAQRHAAPSLAGTQQGNPVIFTRAQAAGLADKHVLLLCAVTV